MTEDIIIMTEHRSVWRMKIKAGPLLHEEGKTTRSPVGIPVHDGNCKSAVLDPCIYIFSIA